MKRHSGLVPLSHDHHHELAEARRLLRAAGADDAALRVAAADRYVRVFFGETVEHFRKEEELLFPLYVHHAGRTAALERVLHEHMQLHGLVRGHPRRHRLDVCWRYRGPVFQPQDVLEQDPERVRQPEDVVAGLQCPEAEDLNLAVADPKGRTRAEAVRVGHQLD